MLLVQPMLPLLYFKYYRAELLSNENNHLRTLSMVSLQLFNLPQYLLLHLIRHPIHAGIVSEGQPNNYRQVFLPSDHPYHYKNWKYPHMLQQLNILYILQVCDNVLKNKDQLENGRHRPLQSMLFLDLMFLLPLVMPIYDQLSMPRQHYLKNGRYY